MDSRIFLCLAAAALALQSQRASAATPGSAEDAPRPAATADAGAKQAQTKVPGAGGQSTHQAVSGPRNAAPKGGHGPLEGGGLPTTDPLSRPGTEDVALPPSPLPPRLDHEHQFGLDLGLGLGYRLIKPYGDIWCGQRSNDPDNPNDPFCSSMSPLVLDLGLSFGVTRSVELVVHTRIGLMKDPISERRPISLLGGVRLWVDDSGAFKWALGIEAMVDFTKQDGTKQQRPTYGIPEHDELDVGGRFYGQLQYDFLPYLGLYAQMGGLVGALRWLRVEMEGTLGIQGRLPRF